MKSALSRRPGGPWPGGADVQGWRGDPSRSEGRSGKSATVGKSATFEGCIVRRLRNQATGLPVWWVELLMLAVLYYSYTGTRSVADASAGEAMRMGHDLLRFETFLHVDIELSLNRWLQNVPVLAVVCCYYYATLHFVVTPGMLVWTHRRHTRHYAQIRWTLAVTTLICLLGFFLFPTAPPRLLTGTSYTDTMSHFAGWGWWSGSASAAPNGLERLTNQYAALPSLHCGWSLWCGFLLVRFGRRRVTRILGVLYPAATFFVVMSTANHYLLDAVAGWMVLGVAAGSVALVFAWRRRVRATPAAVANVGRSGAAPVAPAASATASATAAAATALVTAARPRADPDVAADPEPAMDQDPTAGPSRAADALVPDSSESSELFGQPESSESQGSSESSESSADPTAARPAPPAEPASPRAAPAAGRQETPGAATVPPVPAPTMPELSLRSERVVRPDGARAV
ncbi:phosphatase PAP2 family protein [Candidatus Frankia alpina]|uniref:phosphatase PAP2 family protein n=1 Tax=Candidatus Frankia alpina TaxID=2699483 RepID=UPI001F29864C|nr:phosphatase PAP2 family protein [Candidatus Frankia alpina]